ncbi:MAG: ammonium transporter [archaeon]|nr:ammonium transporter [archaeon]
MAKHLNKKIGFIALAALVVVSVLFLSQCSFQSVTLAPGSSGDFVWILVSSALVFMMVPALALFYGGMLRKQSMTSIMAQVLIDIVVMTLMWVICGFTLTFGSDGVLIGDLSHFFFNGMLDGGSPDSNNALAFAVFQMMFAVITGAIIIGACAERVRFVTITWFLVLWGLLVYVPVAHWIWGGGFLSAWFTVLDYAGGITIHILAGVTGLALAWFVGPRRSSSRKARAHNIPFVFFGAIMLWVGWFGFNGGSGLYADGMAIRAIFTSHLAAAAGMGAWCICQYYSTGHVNVLGMVTGAIAGLGSVTPMAGYIDAPAAFVVGIVGGILCYYAIIFMRSRKNIDDALDVFGLHGVSGFWGSIATGIFVSGAYTPGGVCGLVYGGVDLFIGQVVASAVVGIYGFAVTYAIIYLLSRFMAVRIPEQEESIGQDIVEHGEPSYSL